MEDETSDTNLEWKKKGFESKETLTLKTNVKKALQYEATAKKPVQNGFSPLPSELPKGLKKIRKKIKDVYDDEEDEEENEIDFSFMEQNNTLLNALHEDERRQLKQQEQQNNVRILQDTGKLDAIHMANKVSQDLGMKGLKQSTINNSRMDVSMGIQTFDRALKEDLSKRTNIKGRKLSEAETVTLLRGIKRIQNVAAAADESKLKAIEGWKLEDIVNAGRSSTDDKQIAAKILEKSGRKSESVKKKMLKNSSRTKSTNKNKDMRTSGGREVYRD